MTSMNHKSPRFSSPAVPNATPKQRGEGEQDKQSTPASPQLNEGATDFEGTMTIHDAIEKAMEHMRKVDSYEGRMQVLEIIEKYQPLLAGFTQEVYAEDCAGCGAMEGELHEWGCDFEFCPQCGFHDITDCGCDLQSPSDCAECGRWPFCGYRQSRCDRCAGRTSVWMVPDDEWTRVTGPQYYHSSLCIFCFARMRSIVDQHRGDIALEYALRVAAKVCAYKSRSHFGESRRLTERLEADAIQLTPNGG